MIKIFRTFQTDVFEQGGSKRSRMVNVQEQDWHPLHWRITSHARAFDQSQLQTDICYQATEWNSGKSVLLIKESLCLMDTLYVFTNTIRLYFTHSLRIREKKELEKTEKKCHTFNYWESDTYILEQTSRGIH